jgi:hypothetical protein
MLTCGFALHRALCTVAQRSKSTITAGQACMAWGGGWIDLMMKQRRRGTVAGLLCCGGDRWEEIARLHQRRLGPRHDPDQPTAGRPSPILGLLIASRLTDGDPVDPVLM